MAGDPPPPATPPPTPPPPPPEAGEAPRGEMRDAPPFLTWRAIYLMVLGALAAQVVLYGALTVLYR